MLILRRGTAVKTKLGVVKSIKIGGWMPEGWRRLKLEEGEQII